MMTLDASSSGGVEIHSAKSPRHSKGQAGSTESNSKTDAGTSNLHSKTPFFVILTAEQARMIYTLRSETTTHNFEMRAMAGKSSLVAEMYGVSPKTIRDVWNRKTWTQVTRSMWTAEEIDHFEREHMPADQRAALGHVEPDLKRRGRPPGSKDARPRKRRYKAVGFDGDEEEHAHDPAPFRAIPPTSKSIGGTGGGGLSAANVDAGGSAIGGLTMRLASNTCSCVEGSCENDDRKCSDPISKFGACNSISSNLISSGLAMTSVNAAAVTGCSLDSVLARLGSTGNCKAGGGAKEKFARFGLGNFQQIVYGGSCLDLPPLSSLSSLISSVPPPPPETCVCGGSEPLLNATRTFHGLRLPAEGSALHLSSNSLSIPCSLSSSHSLSSTGTTSADFSDVACSQPSSSSAAATYHCPATAISAPGSHLSCAPSYPSSRSLTSPAPPMFVFQPSCAVSANSVTCAPASAPVASAAALSSGGRLSPGFMAAASAWPHQICIGATRSAGTDLRDGQLAESSPVFAGRMESSHCRPWESSATTMSSLCAEVGGICVGGGPPPDCSRISPSATWPPTGPVPSFNCDAAGAIRAVEAGMGGGMGLAARGGSSVLLESRELASLAAMLKLPLETPGLVAAAAFAASIRRLESPPPLTACSADAGGSMAAGSSAGLPSPCSTCSTVAPSVATVLGCGQRGKGSCSCSASPPLPSLALSGSISASESPLVLPLPSPHARAAVPPPVRLAGSPLGQSTPSPPSGSASLAGHQVHPAPPAVPSTHDVVVGGELEELDSDGALPLAAAAAAAAAAGRAGHVWAGWDALTKLSQLAAAQERDEDEEGGGK